ncbi:MAG: Fe-S protein assembly co-chaperone HscB [Alphaproteobacteria bacterium]
MSGVDTIETKHAAGKGPDVVVCWSCKGPVSPRALFCATCGSVQPPHPLDHFARLGLSRTFDLVEDDLARQYFGLQARLHPDRFATKSARERAISMSQATALNQAYQVLRDPVTRAEHLLSLAGVPVHGDASGTVSDPELLMETMERREELASAQSAQDVARIAARADTDMRACVAAVSKAFRAGDPAGAARLTTRLKYLTKLADEARARAGRFQDTE